MADDLDNVNFEMHLNYIFLIINISDSSYYGERTVGFS